MIAACTVVDANFDGAVTLDEQRRSRLALPNQEFTRREFLFVHVAVQDVQHLQRQRLDGAAFPAVLPSSRIIRQDGEQPSFGRRASLAAQTARRHGIPFSHHRFESADHLRKAVMIFRVSESSPRRRRWQNSAWTRPSRIEPSSARRGKRGEVFLGMQSFARLEPQFEIRMHQFNEQVQTLPAFGWRCQKVVDLRALSQSMGFLESAQ